MCPESCGITEQETTVLRDRGSNTQGQRIEAMLIKELIFELIPERWIETQQRKNKTFQREETSYTQA